MTGQGFLAAPGGVRGLGFWWRQGWKSIGACLVTAAIVTPAVLLMFLAGPGLDAGSAQYIFFCSFLIVGFMIVLIQENVSFQAHIPQLIRMGSTRRETLWGLTLFQLPMAVGLLAAFLALGMALGLPAGRGLAPGLGILLAGNGLGELLAVLQRKLGAVGLLCYVVLYGAAGMTLSFSLTMLVEGEVAAFGRRFGYLWGNGAALLAAGLILYGLGRLSLRRCLSKLEVR